MRLFRILFLLPFILSLGSCAVLTRQQLEKVENLTFRADSVASSPVAIFRSLHHIRTERGLFYAASLTSAESRFHEVEALAESIQKDRRTAGKAAVYIDVLNSYIRSLKSLSSDERWRAVGREIRGIGIRLDSMICYYNSLNVKQEIPTGFARLTGRIFGTLGEEIMKGKRARLMQEFVQAGDTLVAACCDTLVSVLKSEEMEALLRNESEGLDANYRTWLRSQEQRELYAGTEADRRYFTLREEMEQVKKIRIRSGNALRSFRNAHHALNLSLQTEDEAQFYPVLLEFNQTALRLCALIRKL